MTIVFRKVDRDKFEAVCNGAKRANDPEKMYDSFPAYRDKIDKHGLVAWKLSD